MKKILVLVVMCFFLCACSESEKNGNAIEKLMQENEYVILDVRSESEFSENHLVGAINVPYDKIDEKTELDKEKIIFVYCKSGARSGIAYETLTDLGYTVYDLGSFAEIDLPKE